MFSLKKSCLNTCPSVLSAGFAVLFSLSSAQAEQVIFTEINYNPAGDDPEFIEITNNTATPFDIGTWYFSDGVDYTFPDFSAGDTGAHILKHWERILVTNVDEATFGRGRVSAHEEAFAAKRSALEALHNSAFGFGSQSDTR